MLSFIINKNKPCFIDKIGLIHKLLTGMKKAIGYFVTAILGIYVFFSCKKDVESYVFPSSINIENKECLQIWDALNFQLENNYGSKIYLYSIYAWYGLSEDVITINPMKSDYSTDGIKFSIDQRQLGINKYIYIQLKGYASDKGFIGDSKIYKFKKVVTNGCAKWIVYNWYLMYKAEYFTWQPTIVSSNYDFQDIKWIFVF